MQVTVLLERWPIRPNTVGVSAVTAAVAWPGSTSPRHMTIDVRSRGTVRRVESSQVEASAQTRTMQSGSLQAGDRSRVDRLGGPAAIVRAHNWRITGKRASFNVTTSEATGMRKDERKRDNWQRVTLV